MIKVRIRPFISGSVDWFPPNIVIPGPESDVIWWIVTNFVVICAVTFFIMKRSILLFTTLFFLPETLNHLVVFDKAAVMTNVSPPPLFLLDRFILFCLLVLIMVSSREPQYVVLHAVNTLIDSQLTDRVKVISYTEKAIPLLLSTSRFFFWFIFVLVLMIWYTVYIQLSLNFSWELNLKKIIYLLQRNRALLQSLF